MKRDDENPVIPPAPPKKDPQPDPLVPPVVYEFWSTVGMGATDE